jgi:hypothetical protein
MSQFPSKYPKQATPFYLRGCLSGFLIPPLVVILIGLVLVLTLTQVELSFADSPSTTSNQAQGNQSVIAPLFTPEVQYWHKNIAVWSKKWGLDANLIATVMQIESCGNPKARSNVGAIGLFQVMPYHFVEGEDPYKPGINASRGLAYLKKALDTREGVLRYGLAGYNGGINGAQRTESAWPSETVRYVYWGTGIYQDAQAGKSQSDRLDEWLARGGANLCAQAASTLGIQP